MGESFRIFGTEKLLTAVADVQAVLKDPRLLLRVVGDMGVASVQKNFEVGGRPRKWSPLSTATLEQQYKNRKTGQLKPREKKSGGITAGYRRFVNRKQILVNSGRLYRSITRRVSGTSVLIGTNVVYAAAHQFGVGPHTIRPTKKKALAWPGAPHPVKKVNHPGLRPRPFMIIPAEDWPAILEACRKLLPLGGPS